MTPLIHYFLIPFFIIAFHSTQAQNCEVNGASPRTISFGAAGGTRTISVRASPYGCSTYAYTPIGSFFGVSRSGGDLIISCNVNRTLFSRSGRIDFGSTVIQVSQAPACASQDPPGNITGPSSVCVNTQSVFNTTATNGATHYTWSVTNGTVVSGQGTLSATIGVNGSPCRVSVTARNACLNVSTTRTKTITVLTGPAAPTGISHKPNLCAGNNYTFAVVPTAGYTYQWTVNGSGYGIQGGQGTSSINLFAGPGQGIVSVQSVSNAGCRGGTYSKTVTGNAVSPIFNFSGNGSICPGQSTTLRLDGSVTGTTYTVYKDGSPPLGESPETVTAQTGTNGALTFGPFTKEGTYQVKALTRECDVTMNGSVRIIFKPAPPPAPVQILTEHAEVCRDKNIPFSIAPVSGASSYTWSTTGTSAISGQGTFHARITFRSSGTQTVSVTANNSCGSSAPRTIRIIIATEPVRPSQINHKPILCAGNNYTFSVAAQERHTYAWVVEGTGYVIEGGHGTPSINLKIGPGQGLIRVRATNSTGCVGDEITESISGNAASPVFQVSGNGSICPGTSTTVHLDGSVPETTYTIYRDGSVPAEEGAEPVVSLTGNNAPLTFGPFTKQGVYTVRAIASSCETEMQGNVSVVVRPAVPDQPGVIEGTMEALCRGDRKVFSVSPVDRAESYTWTGGNIVSGQGTPEANIQVLSTTMLSVVASNGCGSSAASEKRVFVVDVAKPVFTSTHPTPCAGGKYGYRVEYTTGHTYRWEAPADWEILGTQGGSSIQMRAGRHDGTVKVTPYNGECPGEPATLFVDIIQPPGIFDITGSRTICDGDTYTLSLSGSVTGNSYTLMKGEVAVETKAGTNSPLTFGPYINEGKFRIYSSMAGDCVYPMDGEAVIIKNTMSTRPVSIEASATEACAGDLITLSVVGGIPGKGAQWMWYEGSCAGSPFARGSKISKKIVSNTTIYVRAEGVCNTTACANIAIQAVTNCPNRKTYNYRSIQTPLVPGYGVLPAGVNGETILREYHYFDFLGRPDQTIQSHASPSGNDFVSVKFYDTYGRETKNYLPMSQNSGGLPVESPIAEVEKFYRAGSDHPENIATTEYPFAQTVPEDSPLGRIEQQGAAGEAWQIRGLSTDHVIRIVREFNKAGEVLRLVYDKPGEPVRVASPYPANDLFVTRTTDEQGHEVAEFKDKKGRLILRKVEESNPGGIRNYAETYYLYDTSDKLRKVVQPKAVLELKRALNQP